MRHSGTCTVDSVSDASPGPPFYPRKRRYLRVPQCHIAMFVFALTASVTSIIRSHHRAGRPGVGIAGGCYGRWSLSLRPDNRADICPELVRHLSRAESDICPELSPTCSSGHDRSLDRDLTVTLSSENRHRYVANHRPFFKMPPPGPWSALVSLTLSTLPYLAVTVRWGPESGASRLSTEPVRCRRLARESVWTSSCCS